MVLSVMLVMFKSFPTTSDLRKEKTLTRQSSHWREDSDVVGHVCGVGVFLQQSSDLCEELDLTR